MPPSSPTCAELTAACASLARASRPWPALLGHRHLLVTHHLTSCDCEAGFTRLLARLLGRLTPADQALLALLAARLPAASPFPSSLPLLSAAAAGSPHPSLRSLRRSARDALASPPELLVIGDDLTLLTTLLRAPSFALAASEDHLALVLPATLASHLEPSLDLRLRLPLSTLPSHPLLAPTLLAALRCAPPAAALAATFAALHLTAGAEL